MLCLVNHDRRRHIAYHLGAWNPYVIELLNHVGNINLGIHDLTERLPIVLF
jgi:hypothetical protein